MGTLPELLFGSNSLSPGSVTSLLLCFLVQSKSEAVGE